MSSPCPSEGPSSHHPQPLQKPGTTQKSLTYLHPSQMGLPHASRPATAWAKREEGRLPDRSPGSQTHVRRLLAGHREGRQSSTSCSFSPATREDGSGEPQLELVGGMTLSSRGPFPLLLLHTHTHAHTCACMQKHTLTTHAHMLSHTCTHTFICAMHTHV